MFELFQSDKDGKYYFRLKAENGETILQSQSYARKTSCLKGIASVKNNATDASRFEQITAVGGKLYFVLKAANARVIGTSQMYTSADGVRTGIESVRQNAPQAEIRSPEGGNRAQREATWTAEERG